MSWSDLLRNAGKIAEAIEEEYPIRRIVIEENEDAVCVKIVVNREEVEIKNIENILSNFMDAKLVSVGRDNYGLYLKIEIPNTIGRYNLNNWLPRVGDYDETIPGDEQ